MNAIAQLEFELTYYDVAHMAGAVEYTDCISAEEYDSLNKLLLTCNQDWTCNLQMIVSIES